MSIPPKVLNYLEATKIAYKPVQHKVVYTAYDLAQTMKIKLSEVAKVLVVKADRGYILAVLSAARNLDLGKLKKIVKAKKIEIAKENTMKKVFKVKPGAMTPFGSLYKVPVYVDKVLLRSKKIVANAGTHEDSVIMTAKNFAKAVNGVLGNFGKKK